MAKILMSFGFAYILILNYTYLSKGPIIQFKRCECFYHSEKYSCAEYVIFQVFFPLLTIEANEL